MKKKAVCGMCQNKCFGEVTLEDGRITKVEPDRDSPRGRVCARGRLSPELVYSPNRVLHPMIRDGEKGEGKFRTVSWEEALAYIEQKVRAIVAQYGPQALASYTGGSLLEESYNTIKTRAGGFFANLGSPNDMSASSTCNYSSNVLTPLTTYGIPKNGHILADTENSEIIFIWGKNSKTDSGPLDDYKAVLAAKERGCRVVVIDPRKEGMGELADWWVPVIPGSDGALAMAMLKLIVESGRWDKKFVEQYTVGFDELCRELEGLSLAELSRCCGVPVEDIRRLTDWFCSTTRISLISYTGLEYQYSGVQNNRTIQILWAITGKVDAEGGIYLDAIHQPARLRAVPEKKDWNLGAEKYPLFYAFTKSSQFVELPRAVLEGKPYPIRVLMIGGTSPSITYPTRELWAQVYRKLDLFIVTERYWSNDCLWADVILPVTTLWENITLCTYPGGARLRQRVIEPLGEAKSDLEVSQAIAQRLGFGEKFPKNDEELYKLLFAGREALLHQLQEHPEGVTFPKKEKIYRKYESGLLRQDGLPGFPTPSGKFEIASTYFAECGYSGVPQYHDIREVEGLCGEKGELPFTMTTGARSGVRFSSFGPEFSGVTALEPHPTVDIDPEDARELGIAEGDLVAVHTACGCLRFPAHLAPMARGCVHVCAGGGSAFQQEGWRDRDVNDICTMQFRDPVSGFITYKSMPCRLEKCPQQA